MRKYITVIVSLSVFIFSNNIKSETISIFQDKLIHPWRISSSGISVKEETVENSGILHVYLKEKEKWQGFCLRGGQLDLSKLNINAALVFDIKADHRTDAAAFGIEIGKNSNRIYVPNYISEDNLFSTNWQHLRIPIKDFFSNSELCEPTIKNIDQLFFYFYGDKAKGGFQIKDIKFEDMPEEEIPAKNEIIDDFENGVDKWKSQKHDNESKMVIESTKEDVKAGHLSALILMKGKGIISIPLDGKKAIEAGYDRISFWIKQGPIKCADNRAIVSFIIKQNGKNYLCNTYFSVPEQWGKIVVSLKQAYPTQACDGIKLHPENIKELYFSYYDRDACFYIDQIQFETPENERK